MGDSPGPGDCVKVATRLRPLSSKELASHESSIIECETNSELTGTGMVKISDPDGKENMQEFAFDLVFGTDVTQDTVFNSVGKPALEQAMTGYNGTIFAYGQTGSGKSWSMMGAHGDLRGIIPRVNEELFVRIAAEMESITTRRFLVMCSFFEIYNEIIFDLLNPCQDRSKLGAGLQVKEHPVLGIYVKDLQEIKVEDSDKLGKLMDSGTKNRAVSSTLMNSVSSRSHSIFTVKVHQKDEEDKSRNVFAKFNMVDLAGSERQKGTGASGQTLKEGANINKSLSALGNVINALVENANGKKIFVPFRNSKLTRVLQESLGGNSLCTMLAALSPAACNYEETLSTLRYANRAKAIKVSATKNEEASQISRLNAEIEELKKKLATASTGKGGGGGNSLLAEEERQEMKAKFEAQLQEMQQMVSSTWEEKSRISAENEEKLSRALDEHKRQAKKMQEECRKRINLLQEQKDLELSIRGLLDTVMSLPTLPDFEPLATLRSGELPKSWLKTVGAISEMAASLKQEHTMALVFHGAFNEDLRLWVEGEEAADHTTAHMGARRAQTKLETLRRELSKLCSFKTQGQSKAQEFATAAAEAHSGWTSGGSSAILAEIRKSTVGESEEAQLELDVPPVYVQNLEDIGRILQLIEQQAVDKANDIQALASFKIESTVELVLRGSSLIPGAASEGVDANLLEASAPRPVPANEAQATISDVPREKRPLHEWTAQDVDETAEGTELVLAQLVPLANLSKSKKKNTQELLGKPPPKFVHEVVLAIKQETGFLPSLSEEWPDPREAKIDILQSIADTVAKTFGITVEFNPENVLKGREVPQTLRLFQLFAVAAATHMHRARNKTEGSMDATQAVPVLEAIARCIQRVLELQAARRQPQDGHSSPTRELESKYKDLQEQLAEETQNRRRREEKLTKLEEEMKITKSLLTERSAQLEEANKQAANADTAKAALRQQVEVLRKGLLSRAQEMASNAEISRMKDELQEVVVHYSKQNAQRLRVSSEVKMLQQQQLETNTQNETMELELKRLKLHVAENIDGLSTGESEEIMVLQAEKQKWDIRVVALEDKMKEIAELDDAERQREPGLIEEKQLQSSKNDDSQMQLQVVVEERDGLREGMDLLFQEKTRADEELENVTQGYTNLSDILCEKIEESRELEEQLQQYEYLHTMLQEQFGKRQHSPAKSAEPKTINPTASNDPADDGDGSSHYSDEAFEDYDEKNH